MKSLMNNIYDTERKLFELSKHTSSDNTIQFLKENVPDDIFHAKIVDKILSKIETPDIIKYIKENYQIILQANNCYSRHIRTLLHENNDSNKYIEEFERLYKNIKRDGAESLLGFLKHQTDFYTAPASSKYHNSREHGLIEHSVNVCKNMIYLYESHAFHRFGIKYSNETLAIVALLHDICKIFNYEKTEKDNETSYKYRPHEQLGHGDYSIFIIENFMHLTYEEANAIRWHMGFTEPGKINSVGESFENNPLAFMLAIADMMATYYDEQTPGR